MPLLHTITINFDINN